MKRNKHNFNEEVDKLYRSLNIDAKRQNQGIRTTINQGSIFSPLQQTRSTNYSCEIKCK